MNGYIEAQKKIFDLCGYVPTEAQWVIHRDRSRIKEIAGGERAGKSITNAMELISRFYSGRLFWLVASDYEGTRGEWNHLLEAFERMGLLIARPTKNIDPGRMSLEGDIEIITKSAKYPQKIAVEAPDGILLCEAAQIDYETYLRLRGRLAEKRAWMSMAGTFEGSLGWYPEFFTRWQSYNIEEAKSFSLPSWSNTYIFPGGRQDPEILKLEEQTTAERFLERYAGVPCPPTGLVIKEFSNQIHVGDYSFNKDLPVRVAVDPGYAGAHAVEAIQEWGEQIVLVDEVYLQGYVSEEIIDICKQKPWWGNVSGGAMDIAGKQHQAMEAPIEVWLRKAGISLQTMKVGIEDGIDLLRTYLKPNPITGKPIILINSACKGFISECGGGKSPVEGGGMWLRDKNTNKPIDKNNHATKAVIYYLVNKFGYTGRATRISPMQVTGEKTRETYVRT